MTQHFVCANGCGRIVNDARNISVSVEKEHSYINGYVCVQCYDKITKENKYVPVINNCNYLIAATSKRVSPAIVQKWTHIPLGVAKIIDEYQAEMGYFFLKILCLTSVIDLRSFLWRSASVAVVEVNIKTFDEKNAAEIWKAETSHNTLWRFPWSPDIELWWKDLLQEHHYRDDFTDFFEPPSFHPKDHKTVLQQEIAELEETLKRKRRKLEEPETEREAEDRMFREWTL